MGRIRIIAGEFKGRRLVVPEGLDVRPTSERVREALFSILGSRVLEARVLDAYAGTGALGIEALSRGAREVVFVESDPAAARRIREHLEALGVVLRAPVHQADALAWLRGPGGGGPFGLILADPPYAAEEGRARFGRASAVRLARGGWLVLERDAAASPAPLAGSELVLFRSARYGRSCLDFYERPSSGYA
jgi:16S rRNA (guanine(966)-N(2))-methyltransferase RsmD